jgi:hypothetical protein
LLAFSSPRRAEAEGEAAGEAESEAAEADSEGDAEGDAVGDAVADGDAVTEPAVSDGYYMHTTVHYKGGSNYKDYH